MQTRRRTNPFNGQVDGSQHEQLQHLSAGIPFGCAAQLSNFINIGSRWTQACAQISNSFRTTLSGVLTSESMALRASKQTDIFGGGLDWGSDYRH